MGSKARCLPCLCARSQRAFAELHGRPSRGGCSTAQGEKAGGRRHPERLRSKHRDRGIPAFPSFPRNLRRERLRRCRGLWEIKLRKRKKKKSFKKKKKKKKKKS